MEIAILLFPFELAREKSVVLLKNTKSVIENNKHKQIYCISTQHITHNNIEYYLKLCKTKNNSTSCDGLSPFGAPTFNPFQIKSHHHNLNQ